MGTSLKLYLVIVTMSGNSVNEQYLHDDRVALTILQVAVYHQLSLF